MAVALYARVSTAKQAEKELSIPDQLRQLRAWCKAQGRAVGAEYVEAGASATDDRRPVFQQMIADATLDPPPFEAIIVHSRSRFFRDLYELLRYERMLKRSGVRVDSITLPRSLQAAGPRAKVSRPTGTPAGTNARRQWTRRDPASAFARPTGDPQSGSRQAADAE